MKVKDISAQSEVLGCQYTGKTRTLLNNAPKRINKLIELMEEAKKYKNLKFTAESEVQPICEKLETLGSLLMNIGAEADWLGDSLEHLAREIGYDEYKHYRMNGCKCKAKKTIRRK